MQFLKQKNKDELCPSPHAYLGVGVRVKMSRVNLLKSN